MNKKEVAMILESVAAYYPGFKVNSDNAISIISTWHRVLKDYEFNSILENLDQYARNNKFAPSVADLINPSPNESTDRYIPSVEETRRYLEAEEQHARENENNPIVKAAREKAQAEIRKMLGLEPKNG